jgi:beta-lactam-binding protein with PASTA domain
VAPEKAMPISSITKQADLPARQMVKRAAPVAINVGADAVPDFTGLSLREALEKAQSLKVKVRLQGNGYVVKQLPAAGGHWNDEEVLVLSLQG